MLRAMGIFGAAALLAGCASSSYVNEKYTAEKFDGAEMFVSKVSLENISLKTKYLGITKRTFAKDYGLSEDAAQEPVLMEDFNLNYFQTLNSSSKKIRLAAEHPPLHGVKTFKIVRVLNPDTPREDTLFFEVPERESLLDQDIHSRFILVCQKLSFYFAYHGQYSEEYIRGDLQYLVWDYDKSDVVAFGTASGEEPNGLFNSKDSWIKVYQKCAGQTLKNTPFAIASDS